MAKKWRSGIGGSGLQLLVVGGKSGQLLVENRRSVIGLSNISEKRRSVVGGERRSGTGAKAAFSD